MSRKAVSGTLRAALTWAALLSAALPVAVLAQGSGSSRSTPSRPRQPTVEEFAATMWQYVNRDQAPYRAWASAAAAAPDSVDDPHGKTGKAFWNDVAAKDPQQPPFGSILVREDNDERGQPRAVSVMYRVRGADPQNFDWYWLQFSPTGSLMKVPGERNRPVAGRVASCIACHQKAEGGDLVFSAKPAADKPTK